jgi:hypothetical protein
VTTKSNILELNGRPYDAITGVLMADHPAHRAFKAIDGFINNPRHSSATESHSSKPEPSNYKSQSTTSHTTHTQAQAFDIQHHTAQPTNHHQPQRATTLMRHVVHKPAASLKRQTKVTIPTDILSKIPHFDIMPKHSISLIDQDRLKRAERIAKSKLISRFGNIIAQPHPTVVNNNDPKPVQPERIAPLSSLKRQPSDDIFERALAHATSHTQPAFKHKKHVAKKSHLRRLTSITAASLAVLTIMGFVAYQNVGQIQVHIASSKAGINAVLPKWQPSGFAIGTVHSSPGTVAVNFRGSNKSFSLVQTASKWNNTSLFDNFVFPDSNSYETVQAAGTTIYTYNDNNATWVNNGIWYKLISNGALSNSQLVNIAVSM